MSKVEFLVPCSAAMDAAWQLLAHHPLNRGLAEPCVAWSSFGGDAWQYMGTVDGHHEFRHRCHPRTQQREVTRLR
jgi:hypothetical protein